MTTNGFKLWCVKRAPIKNLLVLLARMQRKAALWITGTFKSSPSHGVEAIAGLIPLNLHLKKLAERSSLRIASLPTLSLCCLGATLRVLCPIRYPWPHSQKPKEEVSSAPLPTQTLRSIPSRNALTLFIKKANQVIV